MGGAGVVAGLMKALAVRKAKANVVGVCGLVENMPDGNAQRPGDMLGLRRADLTGGVGARPGERSIECAQQRLRHGVRRRAQGQAVQTSRAEQGDRAVLAPRQDQRLASDLFCFGAIREAVDQGGLTASARRRCELDFVRRAYGAGFWQTRWIRRTRLRLYWISSWMPG